MKILLFDNYDSFTYNLVYAIRQLNLCTVDVFRNDAISLEAVGEYDKIVLSPGPGIPEEAGILLPIIQKYASSKAILGVCLGHQAIAQAFGGSLYNLEDVHHGVASTINIVDDDYIFEGLDRQFIAGRYHSWAVNTDDFPKDLTVTALSEEGEIMGLRHQVYDVHGVQFHPESILTPEGIKIIRNFIARN